MKKFCTLILAIIFIGTCLSSCNKSVYAMEKEAKREAAFNDGYGVGYEEGYQEGISDAQKRIENVLSDLSWDTKNKNGVDPETALQILTNYVDGEPVTEEELNQAIWSLKQYYWDSYWAIHDSDSYSE